VGGSPSALPRSLGREPASLPRVDAQLFLPHH
jgi:hypothetical protein